MQQITPESSPQTIDPPATRCCACGEEAEVAIGFTDAGADKNGGRRLRCPLCSAAKQEHDGRGYIKVVAVLLAIGAVGGMVADDPNGFWMLFNVALVYPMSWLSVIPHEAGHALMARLMGLRVLLVSVGIGGKLGGFRIRGVPVEIRALPMSGFVQTSLNVRYGLRARYWLVVLAGPAVNILLLVGGLELIEAVRGGADMRSGPAPLIAFVFGNALLVFLSLWPSKQRPEQGRLSSDGYQLLTVPFIKRAAREQLRQGSRYAEVLFLINADRLEEAMRRLDELAGEASLTDAVASARSHILVRLDRLDEVEQLLREQLARPDVPGAVRAVYENNLAWVLFRRGTQQSLEEAEQVSAAAFRRVPWEPAIRSTRGAVLIERGQPEEGLRLLEHRANRELRGQDGAVTSAVVAYGYHQLGKTAEAARFLRRTEAMADDVVVSRIRRRMAVAGAEQAEVV